MTRGELKGLYRLQPEQRWQAEFFRRKRSQALVSPVRLDRDAGLEKKFAAYGEIFRTVWWYSLTRISRDGQRRVKKFSEQTKILDSLSLWNSSFYFYSLSFSSFPWILCLYHPLSPSFSFSEVYCRGATTRIDSLRNNSLSEQPANGSDLVTLKSIICVDLFPVSCSLVSVAHSYQLLTRISCSGNGSHVTPIK